MTQQQILAAYNREKVFKLIAAIAIDLLGILSYAVPVLGELSDVFIAPLSALLLYALFGSAKISMLGFAEEFFPFTDVLPTGTIFWFRRYVRNAHKTFERFVQVKTDKHAVLNKYIPG